MILRINYRDTLTLSRNVSIEIFIMIDTQSREGNESSVIAIVDSG